MTHPEQHADEVFVTNSRPEDVHLMTTWETKRIGTTAYDIHGNAIDYYVPVFVKRTEVEQKLRERPLDAYKKMLKAR